MNRNILFSCVAGAIGLFLAGCTSPNINPASARPGTGYVDFYAVNTNDLYWDITDVKRNQEVFSEFHPLGEPILRLAFKPGQYQLRVDFLNQVITTPGMVLINVRDGMITPVMVNLLPQGTTVVQTRNTRVGSTYYGRYGRRTRISDNESVNYEVSAKPQPPVPYQLKPQMPYAHPSGP